MTTVVIGSESVKQLLIFLSIIEKATQFAPLEIVIPLEEVRLKGIWRKKLAICTLPPPWNFQVDGRYVEMKSLNMDLF